VRSACGEEPGSPSKIGFRGTRFSLSKANRIYLTDYQKNFSFARDDMVSQFCKDVRAVLGPSWTNARIRIRANGDLYASGVTKIYVGNVQKGDSEMFPGYLNLKSSYNLLTTIPQIFAGPQTSQHGGERWTIPWDSFAKKFGKLGNVGIKYKKGDWIWSKSIHSEFITTMKRRLHLGPKKNIRFYITCDGLIITPIPNNHWTGYGIDIHKQISELNRIAPSAARSIQQRVKLSRERGDEQHHLLFVMGHIDDLMSGNIPVPDSDDFRTIGVDEK